jgi:hypothetical protein
MTIPLKYATAGQEIPLGYFVSSTDGDTEQSPTVNNTDIKLWKNGATSLVNKNSGGASQMTGGLYYCTLDATDTDTYGPMVVYVHVSGSLALKQDCWVMEADAYDALFAASGTGSIESSVQDIASAVANTIANHVLGRNMATARASGEGDWSGRFVQSAFSVLRNNRYPAGSQLIITREDDTTEEFRFNVTVDSGADPVTGLDPTT